MMAKAWFGGALGLLAVAVGLSETARAGFVVYNDAASFQAATASLVMTSIEFEGIAAAGGSEDFGAGGSLALSGVTFSTAQTAALSVADARFYLDRGLDPADPYFNLGSGALLAAEGASPASLNIALPDGILAAGFLLGTFDAPSSGVMITLSTGESFVASAPYPTAAFVGIVSSAPVSWINLTASEGIYRGMVAVDSFTFGAAAPAPAVPEPGSMTLMALGGAGALMFLSRRRAA